jgi:hypothetical protein
MKQALRYVLAVVAGLVVGEVVGVLLGVAIDVIAGADVTGGRWALNGPNVVLAVVKGLVAGYTAGFVAQHRGKLIGAVTAFFPLVALAMLSIGLNRDILGTVADQLDTTPSLWAWIALIPAIVGGHFGTRSKGKGFAAVATGLGAVSMYALYLGSTAFHVYTIIVAYQVSGFGAALVTSATPPIAELYWFIRVWRITGYITNQYDMLFFLLLALLAFGGVMIGIASSLEKRTSAQPP